MLKTGAQYLESIKAQRPNVYKWGKLIEDVTTNPATRNAVNVIAKIYDKCAEDKYKDILTTTSFLSGKQAHRWNTLMNTAEDVMMNAKMKRTCYHLAGGCTGSLCAGWTILNAMWGVSFKVDAACGTKYNERLAKFLAFVEDNALTLSGCLTDAKGNRALRPSTVPNKDSFLHIEKVNPDGSIVIRGYKIQICGVTPANWIVVMPTQGFKAEEKEFAVVAAMPKDAPGITIIETRRPSDTREEEEGGWDGIAGGTTQSYIIFDNVEIPAEHVFLNGYDHDDIFKYAGMVLGNFTNIYRAAIGSCVGGQGDVMIGAAINAARSNGLTRKAFQDKLTQMAVWNETTVGTGLGAMLAGSRFGDPVKGNWVPDAAIAHTNKINLATFPYYVKNLGIEIAGGIAETGCIPSYIDFQSPIYGDTLKKMIDTGACDPIDRVKYARLIEWIAVGAGIPGCLHGGGSPDTGRAVLAGATKWEEYVDYAAALAQATPLKEAKK